MHIALHPEVREVPEEEYNLDKGDQQGDDYADDGNLAVVRRHEDDVDSHEDDDVANDSNDDVSENDSI